uniref:BURP domain-containing protein n=1 Tax=Kalanchoe fedtschenkoi TaxID=63787 RepID=A0A7N0TMJ0_KALFE
MAFSHLSAFLAVLCMYVMTVDAALPSEEYWNSVLPATPMPRAITNALRPGQGMTQLMIAAGNTDYGNNKYSINRQRLAITDGNTDYGGNKKYIDRAPADPLKGLKLVAAGNKKYGNSDYGGNRGESEDQLKGLKLVAAGNKKYGNSDYGGQTIAVNPPTALYFLESDLRPGKVMKMEINRRENEVSGFIPRRVAETMPFASDNMKEVFRRLGIRPGSESVKMMAETVKECEGDANAGEVKQCVTSLESMVDFIATALGKKVRAVSTVADRDGKIQNFVIQKGVEKLSGDEAAVCHKENYPYAVFFCHALKGTRSYLVPLAGADGMKAVAAAVCHVDTSSWNPEHVALRVLNVKPGAVPVCHFLPEYDVVWTRK